MNEISKYEGADAIVKLKTFLKLYRNTKEWNIYNQIELTFKSFSVFSLLNLSFSALTDFRFGSMPM